MLRVLTRSILVISACLFPVATLAAAQPLTPWDIARLRQATSVSVSPDGQWIAYTLQVPRDLEKDEDGPAWSELHVVDPEGLSRAFVTGEANVGRVAWRPPGHQISFVEKRDGAEHPALYGIAVRGGEARKILEHGGDIGAYSWSPDGSRLAFLAPEPLDEDHQDLLDKGFTQQVFEEDWRPVRVWLASPGGDEEPTALSLPGSASELRWSPDGKLLAVALAPTPGIDDEYMQRRLHVVEVESGAVKTRFANPGKLGRVRWSPDSSRLTLVSAADYNDPREGRLLVGEVATGRLEEVLPDYSGHVLDAAWVDGDTVLYLGHEGVEAVIAAVAADGSSHRVRLAPGGPSWRRLSLSRDGGLVALTGDAPDHPSEVFLLPADRDSAERLTHSNPWLSERDLAPHEIVVFEARDGLELEGILLRPIGDAPSGGSPLILVAHGGPEAHFSNGWLTSYSRPGQLAAGRGFAVFYPNYRGSTGRGVEFSKAGQGDFAGREFDDLVDGVDHLIAAGLVDGERVGITGGSYGGYATAWGSTYYSERFAAGVMMVGISDVISKMGTTDIPQELYAVHERHWPWEDWQLMLERSPIYHLDKARTPLLILHGKEDPRVYPGQSLELFRFLKIRDQAPVRLVLYPGEGHGNRRAASRLDYSLRLLRWMEHYLVGPGGNPPDWAVVYEAPEEDAQ